MEGRAAGGSEGDYPLHGVLGGDVERQRRAERDSGNAEVLTLAAQFGEAGADVRDPILPVDGGEIFGSGVVTAQPDAGNGHAGARQRFAEGTDFIWRGEEAVNEQDARFTAGQKERRRFWSRAIFFHTAMEYSTFPAGSNRALTKGPGGL